MYELSQKSLTSDIKTKQVQKYGSKQNESQKRIQSNPHNVTLYKVTRHVQSQFQIPGQRPLKTM